MRYLSTPFLVTWSGLVTDLSMIVQDEFQYSSPILRRISSSIESDMSPALQRAYPWLRREVPSGFEIHPASIPQAKKSGRRWPLCQPGLTLYCIFDSAGDEVPTETQVALRKT